MRVNEGIRHEAKGAEAVPALAASELAERLGVSLRHVRRMQSAGKLPKPVRLGRSVRWDLATIREWLRLGAPPGREFERVQAQQARRAG